MVQLGILVAVAALMTAFCGYFIQAALVISAIVMDMVVLMMNGDNTSRNIFDSFAAKFITKFMTGGAANIGDVVYAIAAGIILVNLTIGIMKALTSELTGERAETIGNAVANAVKAGVLIVLFFGLPFSADPEANGSRTLLRMMLDGANGGLIKIYGNLLGDICRYFVAGLPDIKEVKDTFTIGILRKPVLALICLVLSAAACKSIIEASITFLERLFSMVVEIIMGPIMLAFYSGQQTRDVPKRWIIQLIGHGFAMMMSLWLWGIMLRMCGALQNYDGTGTLNENGLMGDLIALIGASDPILNKIVQFFSPKATPEAEVVKEFNALIILLISIVMVSNAVKNSEKFLNSFGLSTMTAGETAKAALGGVRTTVMANHMARGTLSQAAGAMEKQYSNYRKAAINGDYGKAVQAQHVPTSSQRINGVNIPFTGVSKQEGVDLLDSLRNAGVIDKNKFNNVVGDKSMGLGGSSLNASSNLVSGFVGQGKSAVPVGIYKTTDGSLAVISPVHAISASDIAKRGLYLSNESAEALGISKKHYGGERSRIAIGGFAAVAGDPSGTTILTTKLPDNKADGFSEFSRTSPVSAAIVNFASSSDGNYNYDVTGDIPKKAEQLSSLFNSSEYGQVRDTFADTLAREAVEKNVPVGDVLRDHGITGSNDAERNLSAADAILRENSSSLNFDGTIKDALSSASASAEYYDSAKGYDAVNEMKSLTDDAGSNFMGLVHDKYEKMQNEYNELDQKFEGTSSNDVFENMRASVTGEYQRMSNKEDNVPYEGKSPVEYFAGFGVDFNNKEETMDFIEKTAVENYGYKAGLKAQYVFENGSDDLKYAFGMKTDIGAGNTTEQIDRRSVDSIKSKDFESIYEKLKEIQTEIDAENNMNNIE